MIDEMIKKIARFLLGLFLLSLLIIFFASGYSPPEVFREVLHHNQTTNIDASRRFYSEVENMSKPEDGVKAFREKAKLKKPDISK